MGRPRRDSNKSDSGSTAGNVYNASLAAAQKVNETVSGTSANASNTSLTPQLDVISLVATSEMENMANGSSADSTSITDTNVLTVPSAVPVNSVPQTSNIHRRSLSIAELVSLVSSRGPTGNTGNNTGITNAIGTNTHNQSHTVSTASSAALNALNLPDALRSTLEKADSPILAALLPLIRQKLAAKTSSNRRNSAVDPRGSVEAGDSTTSLESQSSRRSSTASTRSEDHRLSHKLAERKRRKEMKDVFDGLKDVLPPGVPKSSKWEILNEASVAIDDLLEQEQALLNQRNELLKKINDKRSDTNN